MTRYTAGKIFQNIDEVVEVYVNGEAVEEVMECDDEHGFAIVVDRDENGNFIRKGDSIATKVLVGNVQVVFACRHPKKEGGYTKPNYSGPFNSCDARSSRKKP